MNENDEFTNVVKRLLFAISRNDLDLLELMKALSPVCGVYQSDDVTLAGVSSYLSQTPREMKKVVSLIISDVLSHLDANTSSEDLEVQPTPSDAENAYSVPRNKTIETKKTDLRDANDDLETVVEMKKKKSNIHNGELIILEPMLDFNLDSLFAPSQRLELLDVSSGLSTKLSKSTLKKLGEAIGNIILPQIDSKYLSKSHRIKVLKGIRILFPHSNQNAAILVMNSVQTYLQSKRRQKRKKIEQTESKNGKEKLKFVMKLISAPKYRDCKFLPNVGDAPNLIAILKSCCAKVKKGHFQFEKLLSSTLFSLAPLIRIIHHKKVCPIVDLVEELEILQNIDGWVKVIAALFSGVELSSGANEARKNLIDGLVFIHPIIDNPSLLLDDFIQSMKMLEEEYYSDDVEEEYMAFENKLLEDVMLLLQGTNKYGKKYAVFVPRGEKSQSRQVCRYDEKEDIYTFNIDNKELYSSPRAVDTFLYMLSMHCVVDFTVRVKSVLSFCKAFVFSLKMDTRDRKPDKILELMERLKTYRSKKMTVSDQKETDFVNSKFVLDYQNFSGIRWEPRSNGKEIDILMERKKNVVLISDARDGMMSANGTKKILKRFIDLSSSNSPKMNPTEYFEIMSCCGKLIQKPKGMLLEMFDPSKANLIDEDGHDLISSCLYQDFGPRMGIFASFSCADSICHEMIMRYPEKVVSYPPSSIFQNGKLNVLGFSFFRAVHCTPLVLVVDVQDPKEISICRIQADSLSNMTRVKTRATNVREREGIKVIDTYFRERCAGEKKNLKRVYGNATDRIIKFTETQGANMCVVNACIGNFLVGFLLSHGADPHQLELIDVTRAECLELKERIYNYVLTGVVPTTFANLRMFEFPDWMNILHEDEGDGENEACEDGEFEEDDLNMEKRPREHGQKLPQRKRRKRR